jgi:hypothetical protein
VIRRLRIGKVLELSRHPPDELSAGRAVELVCELGGLAPWWLREPVLHRAAGEYPQLRYLDGYRPRLPTAPGSCWIVYAIPEPEQVPALRPALLLPLCWAQGPSHHPHLPANLAALADRIVQSLRLPGWGLQLTSHDHIDRLDLREVDFPADSGWAPLAGGLLLRVEGLLPQDSVWATGAWDRGPADVGGLPAKLDLAAQWGARHFFVPAWRVKDARDHLAQRGLAECELQVGALSAPATPDVRQTLNGYLARLGDRPAIPVRGSPDEGAAFALCVKYHALQAREEGRQFYRSHLLPAVSRRCRRLIAERYPACRPTCLVTVVSDSPELIPLAARALGVRRVLLLYTADKEKLMREARDWLGQPPQDGEGAVAVEAAEFERREEAVACFTRGADPADVVFDLTPGTKLMTLQLEKQARAHYRPSWMYYLEHQTPNNRPVPGTENPRCWRAGQDGP